MTGDRWGAAVLYFFFTLTNLTHFVMQNVNSHWLLFLSITRWHALILPQLHYGCSHVAHCHACHAHYAEGVFPNIHRTQGPQDRTREDRSRKNAALCHFCPWWPWPLTPKFELGRDFCIVYLAAKFHLPTFNRSEVILLTNKQTNKQTDAAENIHLALLCNAGG